MNTVVIKKPQNKFNLFLKIIDQYAWSILLVFMPLFLFISPKTSWILLLIPILWSISFLSGRNPLIPTPFNIMFLLLAMQILISLYATYDIGVSLVKIAGLLFSLTLFFYLVKLNHQKKGMVTTIIILLSAGLGIAVLGLIGTDWSTSKIRFFNPVYDLVPSLSNLFPGITGGFHPNEVAGALLWIIPVWLALLVWMILGQKRIRIQQGWLRYLIYLFLLFVLFFFIFMVFLFTQSRSAYIGFGFSLVVMLGFILPKRLKFVFLGLILIGLIILTILIANGQFNGVINYLFPGSGLTTTAFSINTLSGRIEIWSRAIYAIQDFSFTGMGMNTFRNIVHVLYPLYTVSPDIPVKDIGHAHNEFLQAALDLGIPGLIAFIGIYIASYWMLIASTIRQKKNYYRTKGHTARMNLQFWYYISIGILGGLTAHFIFGLTDAISLGAKPGIIFWIMQSLICSIYFKTHTRIHTA